MRAACCALFASLGAVSAGAALEPTARQIAEYEASDETARVMLLIKLAGSGQHELAKALLQRYPLSGKHAANRTLYIEGLILRAEGDLTGAVAKFRAALADDPKLTLVRADLAKTLVALEEDDSAKHHLDLLAADAPSERDAAGIRAFIDKIDERRPYTVSAYVSVAPTTNVNNGSNHSTVYSPIFGDMVIGEDSKKSSGIGAAVGFSAGYHKRLGNDFVFVAAGSGEARIYDDEDFNAYTLSQSMEMRYMFERGYLGLGGVASQSLKKDDIGVSYYSYGPRASLRLNLTQKDTFTAASVYEWRDYTASATGEGTAWMSDVALTHAFDSSFNVTATGGYDKIDVHLAQNSYATWSAGFGLYKELPWGVTVNLNGEARFSEFDGINVLAGEVRDDTRLIGGVMLTKRDFNLFGFAPALNYMYLNNASNIELYDYDSHSVDFRLTKDF